MSSDLIQTELDPVAPVRPDFPVVVWTLLLVRWPFHFRRGPVGFSGWAPPLPSVRSLWFQGWRDGLNPNPVGVIFQSSVRCLWMLVRHLLQCLHIFNPIFDLLHELCRLCLLFTNKASEVVTSGDHLQSYPMKLCLQPQEILLQGSEIIGNQFRKTELKNNIGHKHIVSM